MKFLINIIFLIVSFPLFLITFIYNETVLLLARINGYLLNSEVYLLKFIGKIISYPIFLLGIIAKSLNLVLSGVAGWMLKSSEEELKNKK